MMPKETSQNFENVQHREIIETENRHIKTIWDLDDEEKAGLRDAFERSKGTARLFVHPYFYQYVEKYDRKNDQGLRMYQPTENIHREEEVRKIVEKILKVNKDGLPVFIMEEEELMPETRQIILDLGSMPNKPIFIASHEDTGYPVVPGAKRKRSDPANWDDLNQLLESYGAKKFIIGGMYLEVGKLKKKDDEAGYELELNKCVGQATIGLSANFTVVPSTATFPDSRKEIREILYKDGLKSPKYE